MRPSTDSTTSDSLLGDAFLEEILRTIGLYDQPTQDLVSDGATTSSETYPTTIDSHGLTYGITEFELDSMPPLGFTPAVNQPDGTMSGVPYVSTFGSPNMVDAYLLAPSADADFGLPSFGALDIAPQVVDCQAVGYEGNCIDPLALYEDQFSACIYGLSPVPDSSSPASQLGSSPLSSPCAIPSSPEGGPDVFWSSSSDFESGAGESCDDDESEYTPSDCGSPPRLPPLTQRRSYTSAVARSRRSSTSSSEASSEASSSSSPPRRVRQPLKSKSKSKSKPTSRKSKTKKNPLPKWSSSDVYTANPRAPSRSIQVPRDFVCPKPVNFVCPICGYHQANGRMPDLKRHMKVHYATNDWVCCGVPLKYASYYGVKDFHNVEFSSVTQMEMVGGCGIVFTRKDAYKRHLLDCKHPCLGDVSGDWLPGNASSCLSS